MRLLFWIAVALFAYFALRRSLGRGPEDGGGAPRRDSKRVGRGGPPTLVCAKCETRYDPDVSGGVCPRCGA